MCRLYANTMPLYIRDLSILAFWYLQGSFGTNALKIPRDDCIFRTLVLGCRCILEYHTLVRGKRGEGGDSNVQPRLAATEIEGKYDRICW